MLTNQTANKPMFTMNMPRQPRPMRTPASQKWPCQHLPWCWRRCRLHQLQPGNTSMNTHRLNSEYTNNKWANPREHQQVQNPHSGADAINYNKAWPNTARYTNKSNSEHDTMNGPIQPSADANESKMTMPTPAPVPSITTRDGPMNEPANFHSAGDTTFPLHCHWHCGADG